jgi:thioredoxin-like negative regulator of GroEL
LQDPAINALADEMGDRAKICKMNVDENKRSAAKMSIRNIPNIIIFKKGKAVKQLIGVKSKRQIENALKSVIGG